MEIWSLLELTPDADVRSVKRRYAQLLKSTRPDEDAEAFQRLRDAYEQALSIAQAGQDGALSLQALELAPCEVQPVAATAVPDSVHEQVAVLVEASSSLDVALQQAALQFGQHGRPGGAGGVFTRHGVKIETKRQRAPVFPAPAPPSRPTKVNPSISGARA